MPKSTSARLYLEVLELLACRTSHMLVAILAASANGSHLGVML